MTTPNTGKRQRRLLVHVAMRKTKSLIASRYVFAASQSLPRLRRNERTSGCVVGQDQNKYAGHGRLDATIRDCYCCPFNLIVMRAATCQPVQPSEKPISC